MGPVKISRIEQGPEKNTLNMKYLRQTGDAAYGFKNPDESFLVNAPADTPCVTFPDFCYNNLCETPLVVPDLSLNTLPGYKICEVELPSTGRCLEIVLEKIVFYFLKFPS